MSFVLQPWQLLAAILAGWVNREQQQRIEYLRTENQVLKEKLGKKRILLNTGLVRQTSPDWHRSFRGSCLQVVLAPTGKS